MSTVVSICGTLVNIVVGCYTFAVIVTLCLVAGAAVSSLLMNLWQLVTKLW